MDVGEIISYRNEYSRKVYEYLTTNVHYWKKIPYLTLMIFGNNGYGNGDLHTIETGLMPIRLYGADYGYFIDCHDGLMYYTSYENGSEIFKKLDISDYYIFDINDEENNPKKIVEYKTELYEKYKNDLVHPKFKKWAVDKLGISTVYDRNKIDKDLIKDIYKMVDNFVL